MFCLDASVIISAAKGDETDSAHSKDFLNFLKRRNAQVFLPELALVEIASGLTRATKRADFVREFIIALRTIPNFIFVPVDSRLADLAANAVIDTGLRSADAVYVALALEYHFTLVTLDKEQLVLGRKIAAVVSPREIAL